MVSRKGRVGWMLAAALLALVAASAFFRSPRGYSGAASHHFDGERFHNLVQASHGDMLDFLQMRAATEYAAWPAWVATTEAAKPTSRLAAGEARATFVNHATVLLQVGSVNILTDPIWSRRASPVAWAGPARAHAPGVAFDDPPPIDAVLVSHDHYDHLDLPTLRRLSRRDRPLVVAGLGLARWLERRDVDNVIELDWWQSLEVGGAVTVTFAPAQHWSGRGLRDRRRTLWGSYIVRGAGRQFYFAGDTAAGPHFGEIARRVGAIDLAMLPIGAYAPASFMASSHLDPEEAVAAHRQLAARRSMAIHFGCFQLSQEGRQEPGEWLARARREAGLEASDFVLPEVGETISLAAGSLVGEPVAP